MNEALSLGVDTILDTMVLDITPQRKIFASSKRLWVHVEIEARSIVLAMGCREKTRAQIQHSRHRGRQVFIPRALRSVGLMWKAICLASVW